MLKLELQYFPTMGKANSLEKTLMLEKMEEKEIQEKKGMTEDEMVEWHH